ncbi:MAG: ABC transporter permease [Cellvibrionaceae bacterium]
MKLFIQLSSVFKKEILLLVRDLHGLVLLFLMPAVFIVIMSLAMQQNFSARDQVKLPVLVSDLADNDDSRALLKNLADTEVFEFLFADDIFELKSNDELLGYVQKDKAAFLIKIYTLPEDDEETNTIGVELLVAPATSKQTEMIFVAALRESLRGVKVEKMLDDFDDDTFGDESLEELAAVVLDVNYAYGGGQELSPSSVQQNVPAWLVFAMFFVVVPLSNTLIKERQLGTLKRLKTIPVSPVILILGKLLPYFIVMQLQVVCMIAVGIFVVPMLGGDQLEMGSSFTALALISFALSLAALGYAFLIAVITKTTEQATMLGGAGNIILAALGGIMIPKFVMPMSMQKISEWSPMNWGLEGFLDVFLRNGDATLVLSKAAMLGGLGIFLIVIASLVMAKRNEA